MSTFAAEGFRTQSHLELGEALERHRHGAAKISGSRIYVLTGIGARLGALLNAWP